MLFSLQTYFKESQLKGVVRHINVAGFNQLWRPTISLFENHKLDNKYLIFIADLLQRNSPARCSQAHKCGWV